MGGVFRQPRSRPCLPQQADNVPASVAPPAGLTPSQVPQFVMFGADDNYYADGILWLVNTALRGRPNSDGTPAQMTFFITAGGGTSEDGGIFTPGSVGQTPAQVISAWQAAYAAGHEVGNHTWDHDQSNGTAGDSYTTAQWRAEIVPSQSFLINQAGFPACELDGWRFPYFEFDEEGFQSFAAAGFLFDTSVEFGYNWWVPPGCNCNGYGPGSPQSGNYYWWPFTLDTGFPSDTNSGFDPSETKGVGPHPGVWEFLSPRGTAPRPTTPAPCGPSRGSTTTCGRPWKNSPPRATTSAARSSTPSAEVHGQSRPVQRRHSLHDLLARQSFAGHVLREYGGHAQARAAVLHRLLVQRPVPGRAGRRLPQGHRLDAQS